MREQQCKRSETNRNRQNKKKQRWKGSETETESGTDRVQQRASLWKD